MLQDNVSIHRYTCFLNTFIYVQSALNYSLRMPFNFEFKWTAVGVSGQCGAAAVYHVGQGR